MAQYENKGDRLNILLADELPEDMTGTQDTQHICGKCAWYSFLKLESICRKTGKEVAYFANRECFTTDKDMDMEENNNAQPVAESTGTQVCKECGRTLPLEDFQCRRYGKRDKVCKACRAEKIRVGMATGKEKKVKVDIPEKIAKAVSAPSPASEAVMEEAVKKEGVEIAELCHYLVEFKMAGLALWGMMPSKEEDIDNMIEAEWMISFCQEIFAAAAELKREGANVVPHLVARRLGDVGRMFIEDLGNAFYLLAQECDTSTRKEKPSVEDVLEKADVKPYKDGNMWCILAGDNLQEGLCGFGDTIEDALCDFLIDVFNAQKEQKSAEWSVEDEKTLRGIIEKGSLHIPMSEYALRDDQIAWLKSKKELLTRNLKKKCEDPADFSDADLLDELRRRGYKGRISKCEEVEI